VNDGSHPPDTGSGWLDGSHDQREIPLDVRAPAPGVRRFTVPLPFPSPDHLHVHVLELPDGDELLVDCGVVGSEAALEAGLTALDSRPRRLLITHAHLDHWGLATTLTDRVLAHRASQSTFNFVQDGNPSRPIEQAYRAALDSAFTDMKGLATGVPQIEPIEDGDRVGDWEVFWTPGHDPGHVCLFREIDGVLLCGDVLLPGFTPNIQPAADGSDALADFLASLRRLAALPITLVLPAHGEPYSDAAARADELIQHHEKRLEELREAMRSGTSSLRDLRNATFRLEGSKRGDRILASMETYAHLEHLRISGEAQMSTDGDWSLAA
jgi:glyoxylase-like metal-dependent hydrolase (beta-lactamase superfamily II)